MKRCERLLKSYQKISKLASDACELKINTDHQQLKQFLLNISSYESRIDDKEKKIYAYMKNWAKGIGEDTNIATLINMSIFDIFVNEYEGVAPLAFLDTQERIIFYKLDARNIPEILSQVQTFFKKFIDFDFYFSAYAGLPDLLTHRLDSIREWYFQENSAYLQALLENFQDTVSQVSFISYLKQRFLAKIHAGQDTVYPVRPPKETLAWRQERLARAATLPRIQGVSQQELQFYYETTFLLEQYAIENVIGVKESDVVVDAGGFVGDTAVYFAQRCGRSGKVYSFEPIPRIVEIARQNIALNGLEDVVEVVPAALSDTCGKFEFMDLASGSRVTDTNQPQSPGSVPVVEVASLTLDAFLERNNIPRVDFIKSDLEGWDMAFLRGAEQTIRASTPACGLTLYHKPEDILEIPQFIQRMDPKYKLWFRSETEPVLFAKV